MTFRFDGRRQRLMPPRRPAHEPSCSRPPGAASRILVTNATVSDGGAADVDGRAAGPSRSRVMPATVLTTTTHVGAVARRLDSAGLTMAHASVQEQSSAIHCSVLRSPSYAQKRRRARENSGWRAATASSAARSARRCAQVGPRRTRSQGLRQAGAAADRRLSSGEPRDAGGAAPLHPPELREALELLPAFVRVCQAWAAWALCQPRM